MRAIAFLMVLIGPAVVSGQSSRAIVRGKVMDASVHRVIKDATIWYGRVAARLTTGSAGACDPAVRDAVPGFDQGTAQTREGAYILALEPGWYAVCVKSQGYEETGQIFESEVGQRLELDFLMRSEHAGAQARSFYRGLVLPSGDIVSFFGGDLGIAAADIQQLEPKATTLDPGLAYVVDPDQVEKLPLYGRDVYPLLVTVPGVTADVLSTRGLGLSVNGQRLYSSNYLLDGVENNALASAGPLMITPPEAIRSYRVSLNNFSTEYGRTGGLVANAVTQPGSGAWHGQAYVYAGNEFFDANSFRSNAQGFPRRPRKELYAGGVVSGNVLGVFSTTVFERYRGRSQKDTQEYLLPGPGASSGNGLAQQLLQRFPLTVALPPVASESGGRPGVAPPPAVETGPVVRVNLADPVALDRTSLIQRFDAGGIHNKLMLRLALTLQNEPDYIYSPFSEFSSPRHQKTAAIALGYTAVPTAVTTVDAHVSWTRSDLGFKRAHPEIPTLYSQSGVTLPGSPALFDDSDVGRKSELGTTVTRLQGAHTLGFGGLMFFDSFSSLQSLGRDGAYYFLGLADFLNATPAFLSATLDRGRPDAARPSYGRDYANTEAAGFIHDDWKVTRRLGLSLGARYEYFGHPSTSADDLLLSPGATGTLAERVSAAVMRAVKPGTALYQSDMRNLSGRMGLSYDLFGTGRSVLRAAYGIFYDRPFDQLTRRELFNRFSYETTALNGSIDILLPINTVIASLLIQPTGGFPELFWVDNHLRTPHIQNWFAALDHALTRNIALQATYMGSHGVKLIATDLLNRPFENQNAVLPEIIYRSNFGASKYSALGVMLNARVRNTLQFRITYTLSVSHDDQSDPLAGESFPIALNTTRQTIAALTREGDSHADWGRSDFSQTHSLVFYSIWEPKGPPRFGEWLRNWRVSGLGSIRSGFPYSVFAVSDIDPLIRKRADLNSNISPDTAVPAPGGVYVLNRAAFAQPSQGAIGNTARNAFIGPGFWHFDASLARMFGFGREERHRTVEFRVDAFNLFNHVNLNQPDNFIGSPTFGLATYGRSLQSGTGTYGDAGLLTGYGNENGRQLQFQLKVYF